MQVKNLPALFEMISFTFYVSQCVLGVFVEYHDFMNWIHELNEYKKVPNPTLPSLRYMVYALLCLATFTLSSSYLPASYVWSEEFTSHPLVYRLVYTFFSWMGQRQFYYIAFMFETSDIIASGLGYNGREVVKGESKDSFAIGGDHKWDKIIGVYIYEVETASNCNSLLRAWNHRVHIWLKHYVSERLTGKDERPTGWHYLATYMISAFWHGFYPMYYVNFFFVAVASFVHKDVYSMWILFRPIPRPIRIGLCIFVNIFTVNYIGMMQTALTIENGFKFLKATYYFVPIMLIITLTATRSLGLVRIAKKLELREKETNPEATRNLDDKKSQ